jgi:hypothetical protein
MAEVKMYVAETDVYISTDESLGFFGPAGFGDPLSLGEFNGRTFITNSSGSVSYTECDNCKKVSTSGVVIGQVGDGINLQNLPNYLATLNIRFTHPQAVLVQDARLIVSDGSSSAPVGLSVYGAEIIHTSKLQTDVGTGDTEWQLMDGSDNPLYLVSSPGESGFSPLGPATLDTRHDWYCAMSVAPTLPGDKQFVLEVSLEFI